MEGEEASPLSFLDRGRWGCYNCACNRIATAEVPDAPDGRA